VARRTNTDIELTAGSVSLHRLDAVVPVFDLDFLTVSQLSAKQRFRPVLPRISGALDAERAPLICP